MTLNHTNLKGVPFTSIQLLEVTPTQLHSQARLLIRPGHTQMVELSMAEVRDTSPLP